ncbi:hypothetical protein PFISCL1PPCAC_486 [Pristionchus fissidentatus]|uniref:Uncharacterized protein n=1 Tax=Pristionchus fissidentatus TaxID=1538716 RepID=A0AAV5UTU5_9BILA|nr:hypothetical protein PFISCL1PPCAC_486 [Pristionchus fissidentatus]
MFSPLPTTTTSASSCSSPPSPTAEYTSLPTTPTEHDISALTPAFAEALSITPDQYSVYSNSSAPPSTPTTLRRAAAQLECNSDRIVTETIRPLREAEMGYSMADHLRGMADDASGHLEMPDDDRDQSIIDSLPTIVPLRRKAE